MKTSLIRRLALLLAAALLLALLVGPRLLHRGRAGEK